MTTIKPSPLVKKEFAGFFNLCPISNQDIKQNGLQELADFRERWMPVLGFKNREKQFSYDLRDCDSSILETWKPRLYQRAEDRSLDSLSIIFASLETPDDIRLFARTFGKLFGYESKMPTDQRLESANPDSLLSLFGSSVEETGFDTSRDLDPHTVTTYEAAADWLIAIDLMKISFALYHFLNTGFAIVRNNDFIGLRDLNSSDKSIIGFNWLGGDWYSIPLRFAPLSFNDSDSKINDENSYYSRVFKRDSARYEEGCYAKRFEASLGIDDRGSLRLIIRLPMLENINDHTIKETLGFILEYLFQAHRVGMELIMKDGDYYYVFDSLLTYLWFDFSQVAVSSRGLGICSFCGKPFFRNNGGERRKYCDSLCRNNAKNKRDARRRELENG